MTEGSKFSFGGGGGGKKKSAKAAALAEKGRGFDLGKALHGISGDEDDILKSAVTTRGDGRFSNGTNFQREGNKVVIGPGAFSLENAEETLATLDAMQAFGPKGARQQATGKPMMEPPAGAAAPETAKKPAAGAGGTAAEYSDMSKEVMKMMAADLNKPTTAGHAILADIDVGEDFLKETEANRSAFELGAAQKRPDHTITEHPPDARYSTRRVEVLIKLPLLDSSKDVELDIGKRELKLRSGSQYRLRASFPFPVDEATGRAKWIKKEKSLKVTVQAPREAEPDAGGESDDEDLAEIAREISSNPFVKEKGRAHRGDAGGGGL